MTGNFQSEARSAPCQTRGFRYWLSSPPVAILVLVGLLALVAPVLSPFDPTTPFPGEKLQPPSTHHWFGTDPLGMDVFSRVLYATRIDLPVALAGVLVGILAGTPLGALAGYLRGRFDGAMMRVTEILQAFPQVLLAMAMFAALGSNLRNLVLILGVLNVPVYLRMVRSATLPLRDSEFVLAARCAGHSTFSLVLKHILPNALMPVFSQFSLSCAYAIQLIAGLSFVGLGVNFPDAEWGSMINLGASHIVFGQWWPSVFPGLAVFLVSYALHGIGRRLERSLAVE